MRVTIIRASNQIWALNAVCQMNLIVTSEYSNEYATWPSNLHF